MEFDARSYGSYLSTKVKIDNNTIDLGLLSYSDVQELVTSFGVALEDMCSFLEVNASNFISADLMQDVILKAFRAGVRKALKRAQLENADELADDVSEYEAVDGFWEEQ